MQTVYFFGAGASKADHFPLTRELLCALAAWLVPNNGKKVTQGRELFAFLESAFGVTLEELRVAAEQWKRHCAAVVGETKQIPPPPERLPNMTDILSILDLLLVEEGGFGVGSDEKHVLKAGTLRRAREQVAAAITYGFRQLHKELSRREDPLLIDQFVSSTKPTRHRSTAFITTNWDILLDQARDKHFGSTLNDYGTDIEMADHESKTSNRPKLFKLHGSLNWLHCPRCSSLHVRVDKVMAHDGYKSNSRNERSKCRNCGMNCEAVLVTPTFLKSYRNRHLLNIWAGAQHALADSDKWVFIGYSLPDDDIHIKALLLKAKQMWTEKESKTEKLLEIQVVTRNADKALKERYQRLFGEDVQFKPAGGFRDFVLAQRKESENEEAKKRRKEEKKTREQTAREKKKAARRKKK